jgi:hypothetical protein
MSGAALAVLRHPVHSAVRRHLCGGSATRDAIAGNWGYWRISSCVLLLVYFLVVVVVVVVVLIVLVILLQLSRDNAVLLLRLRFDCAALALYSRCD